MSDIYLRLKPTTENEKLVERFICGDVQWGGRETRMLDHALSFVSRDEALAHVKTHRLDPATLELVTLTSEPLQSEQVNDSMD